jgi:acetolactate synthase-1/2/3 large subunit
MVRPRRQGPVNPARFFDEVRKQMPDDAIATVDDGNHTFLTAELYPGARSPRADPADRLQLHGLCRAGGGRRQAVHPQREVFAIVGDGAFMMTCMEILTATKEGLGIVYFVFHDGELSQIAQAQEIPYNRKPCTVLGSMNLEGVALATGAAYVRMARRRRHRRASPRRAASPPRACRWWWT